MKLVYLVEDDAFLAKAIADDISDLRCKCRTFPDRASLLAQRGASPSVVLVDLFIPDGSSAASNPLCDGPSLARSADIPKGIGP